MCCWCDAVHKGNGGAIHSWKKISDSDSAETVPGTSQKTIDYNWIFDENICHIFVGFNWQWHCESVWLPLHSICIAIFATRINSVESWFLIY